MEYYLLMARGREMDYYLLIIENGLRGGLVLRPFFWGMREFRGTRVFPILGEVPDPGATLSHLGSQNFFFFGERKCLDGVQVQSPGAYLDGH